MKNLIALILILLSLELVAQEKIPVTESDYANKSVEMADQMRSNGKIYVLVGIIGIIFTGISVYLIRTERKISALEKSITPEE